jgi:hypothetical protein
MLRGEVGARAWRASYDDPRQLWRSFLALFTTLSAVRASEASPATLPRVARAKHREQLAVAIDEHNLVHAETSEVSGKTSSAIDSRF